MYGCVFGCCQTVGFVIELNCNFDLKGDVMSPRMPLPFRDIACLALNQAMHFHAIESGSHKKLHASTQHAIPTNLMATAL